MLIFATDEVACCHAQCAQRKHAAASLILIEYKKGEPGLRETCLTKTEGRS